MDLLQDFSFSSAPSSPLSRPSKSNLEGREGTHTRHTEKLQGKSCIDGSSARFTRLLQTTSQQHGTQWGTHVHSTLSLHLQDLSSDWIQWRVSAARTGMVVQSSQIPPSHGTPLTPLSLLFLGVPFPPWTALGGGHSRLQPEERRWEVVHHWEKLFPSAVTTVRSKSLQVPC